MVSKQWFVKMEPLAKDVYKRQGSVILAATVVLWFLQGFGFENGAFGMVEDQPRSQVARKTLPQAGMWYAGSSITCLLYTSSQPVTSRNGGR